MPCQDLNIDELNMTHLELESLKQNQLSEYDIDAKICESFKLKEGPDNLMFMVWHKSEEEVTFLVQGMMANYVLPPITKQTR